MARLFGRAGRLTAKHGGFRGGQELAAAGGGSGGMNGQLDQIAALAWVQRYVGYFGGDGPGPPGVVKCPQRFP